MIQNSNTDLAALSKLQEVVDSTVDDFNYDYNVAGLYYTDRIHSYVIEAKQLTVINGKICLDCEKTYLDRSTLVTEIHFPIYIEDLQSVNCKYVALSRKEGLQLSNMIKTRLPQNMCRGTRRYMKIIDHSKDLR